MSSVLVFGNDWGFRSRILGAVFPLGDSVILSLGSFSSRLFCGRVLGVWLCLLGLWGDTRMRGV